MTSIKATYTNGQIVLDGQPDWPEGCRLHIEPLAAGPHDPEEPETPEQIADWLRWFRSLEPLEFTPEEEAELAELAAWRQQRKEHSLSKSTKQSGDYRSGEKWQ